MNRAEVWIGLTDGGNGLEEFVRKNFSREPVLILDFWHAVDHLTQLAQLLHPDDESATSGVGGKLVSPETEARRRSKAPSWRNYVPTRCRVRRRCQRSMPRSCST